VCRAEGPAIEQFARDNADTIRVVGLGTQDGLEAARDFVATTGAETPFMLWDESFDSWGYYEVAGQPAAILVDATGAIQEMWLGALDPDEVLALL
jgi:hypothetical protein